MFEIRYLDARGLPRWIAYLTAQALPFTLSQATKDQFHLQ